MSEQLPFVEVEADIKIALRLAAERATLTGAEFTDLLTRLMEMCRKQGYAAANASIQHTFQIEPAPQTREEIIEYLRKIGVKNPRDFVLSEADIERLTRPATKAELEPAEHPDLGPTETVEEHLRRTQGLEKPPMDPPPDGRQKPLLEADKDNIRKRYKNAIQGRERVENGWFRKIAREYNRKVSYIYNVIYSDPSYEAVPRKKGEQA